MIYYYNNITLCHVTDIGYDVGLSENPFVDPQRLRRFKGGWNGEYFTILTVSTRYIISYYYYYYYLHAHNITCRYSTRTR